MLVAVVVVAVVVVVVVAVHICITWGKGQPEELRTLRPNESVGVQGSMDTWKLWMSCMSLTSARTVSREPCNCILDLPGYG